MDLQTCPHCHTRMVITADGTCPSCRILLRDVAAAQPLPVEISYSDNDQRTLDRPTSTTESELNPYASPSKVGTKVLPTRDFESTEALPAVSTDNTIQARYIAALLDNLVAMILGVLAAQSIADDLLGLQLALFVVTFLGYYFIFERVFSRTPGKLLTGLIVVQFDGKRATWRQTMIRTCFRVLEVNPALLGAIPAALCILFLKNHQRLGDKVAGTIVVPSSRLPKNG